MSRPVAEGEAKRKAAERQARDREAQARDREAQARDREAVARIDCERVAAEATAVRRAWAAQKARWAAFAAHPPAVVRFDDIPWPDLAVLAKAVEAGVVEPRTMAMVWHPDKFLQKFGVRPDRPMPATSSSLSTM